MQVLIDRRRGSDIHHDIKPRVRAARKDIYRYYYESEYQPATVARDVLNANDRAYE